MRELLQDWIGYIFGNGMLSIAESILDINPSTGKYGTLWRVFEGIYDNICVPVGMGLVLIYFMVNLIERSMQQQQFDMEQAVKLLLKLIFGMYFIEHGLTLMTSIYSLGLSFIKSIVSTNSYNQLYQCARCSTEFEEVVTKCPLCGGIVNAMGAIAAGDGLAKDAWENLSGEKWNGDWSILESFTKGIPLMLQMVFPYLLSWGIQLICSAVCFFRLIEFYIMTCMAPIAFSDFFTEGMHSNGWRFVKNYLALALQMGVIMLGILAFNGIVSGLLPESGLEDVVVPILGIGKALYIVILYLACGVACCAVLLKSRAIAKEIVGV